VTVTGIEAVTYGVSDLDAARRFLSDWGLQKRGNGQTGAVFATKDGATITIRRREANDLPAAIEDGSTVREVVWGVDSKQALQKIGAKLSRTQDVKVGRDGTIRATDPAGLAIAFQVQKRKNLKVAPTPVNTPGIWNRIDAPALHEGPAEPLTIGHVVLGVPDPDKEAAYYVKNFGFGISDRYMYADMKRTRGLFLRPSTPGGHHNLFLLHSPDGQTHLNHVAFMVRDVNEVFAGGMQFAKKGWTTEIGPGRHVISSAYFWYFKNPCGGAAEYFCDEDRITKKWKPRKFNGELPENFAEWAVLHGVQPAKADIKTTDTHRA